MEREGQHVDLRGARGVLVGDGSIQLNMFTGTARARLRPNAYLEQVRRIAPPELTGRDAELAELARFCLAPDDSDSGTARYTWWQARPWAGKSALMSTFVLHPPAEVLERVHIVSFFITARLAAQDTRQAFTEVVLEQLATLLGKELPPVLPEATRDAYFLDLMREAATSCQDEGGRLVLLVDGLDEDRGVTVGPDAHSIAALLPADPPAEMRVIAAGRLPVSRTTSRTGTHCAIRRSSGRWNPLPTPATSNGEAARNCAACCTDPRPVRTSSAC